jgi:hypothetical protein
MLAACQLNIGDVAIVNVQNTALNEAVSHLSPNKIIDFGTNAQLLFDAGSIVTSVPLKQMLGESTEARQLKGKLWTGLKQMFGL